MASPPVDPTAKASNVPYVIAVVVMALIALVAVLGILMLRPAADNTTLIATVLGFAATTTASIMALMKSQETHLTVNSQLAQWKADKTELENLKGAVAAVRTEQERVERLRSTKAAEAAATHAPVTPAAEPAAVPAIGAGAPLHAGDTVQLAPPAKPQP